MYETTKLFYGEYLCKLSFRNDLNTIFRSEFQKSKLSYARERLDYLNEQYRNNMRLQVPIWRTLRDIREQDYLDARKIYAVLYRTKSDYRVRVESWGGISVFSNDEKLLLKLGNSLEATRVDLHRPSPDIAKKLASKKNIIISANPVCWPYKITLGIKKRNYEGFAKWVDANPDKVKIGEIALEACRTHGYVSGYYFFVKSEKMLDLVNIMVGDNIRRIDQVIYKDNLDK